MTFLFVGRIGSRSCCGEQCWSHGKDGEARGRYDKAQSPFRGNAGLPGLRCEIWQEGGDRGTGGEGIESVDQEVADSLEEEGEEVGEESCQVDQEGREEIAIR